MNPSAKAEDGDLTVTFPRPHGRGKFAPLSPVVTSADLKTKQLNIVRIAPDHPIVAPLETLRLRGTWPLLKPIDPRSETDRLNKVVSHVQVPPTWRFAFVHETRLQGHTEGRLPSRGMPQYPEGEQDLDAMLDIVKVSRARVREWGENADQSSVEYEVYQSEKAFLDSFSLYVGVNPGGRSEPILVSPDYAISDLQTRVCRRLFDNGFSAFGLSSLATVGEEPEESVAGYPTMTNGWMAKMASLLLADPTGEVRALDRAAAMATYFGWDQSLAGVQARGVRVQQGGGATVPLWVHISGSTWVAGAEATNGSAKTRDINMSPAYNYENANGIPYLFDDYASANPCMTTVTLGPAFADAVAHWPPALVAVIHSGATLLGVTDVHAKQRVVPVVTTDDCIIAYAEAHGYQFLEYDLSKHDKHCSACEFEMIGTQLLRLGLSKGAVQNWRDNTRSSVACPGWTTTAPEGTATVVSSPGGLRSGTRDTSKLGSFLNMTRLQTAIAEQIGETTMVESLASADLIILVRSDDTLVLSRQRLDPDRIGASLEEKGQKVKLEVTKRYLRIAYIAGRGYQIAGSLIASGVQGEYPYVTGEDGGVALAWHGRLARAVHPLMRDFLATCMRADKLISKRRDPSEYITDRSLILSDFAHEIARYLASKAAQDRLARADREYGLSPTSTLIIDAVFERGIEKELALLTQVRSMRLWYRQMRINARSLNLKDRYELSKALTAFIVYNENLSETTRKTLRSIWPVSIDRQQLTFNEKKALATRMVTV